MDTAKEVCKAIKLWLSQNDMTMTDMARELGVSLSAVTNQLANRSFGKCNANKYAQAFGFDASFLMTGNGSLLPGKAQQQEAQGLNPSGVYVPQETLKMYTCMAESIDRLTQLVDRLTSSQQVYQPKGGIYPLDTMRK